MSESRIDVREGCERQVEAAINEFSDCWKPYSTQSKKYSISSLIRDVVDHAWEQYVSTLPAPLADRIFRKIPVLSEFTRVHGFHALEDNIISIHSYGRQHGMSNPIIDEFEATLDTLRTFAYRCRGKKSKHLAIENIKRVRPLNSQRAQKYCEFCGQPPELEAFRRDESKWKNDKSSAYFSARFCIAHRPKQHDGSYNSEYKRAIRQKSRFDEELSRLEKQTGCISELRADSGNRAVDQFIYAVITRDALYLDEEGVLRDIAHLLTRKDVSDRKKEIISLLASGNKATEVALMLGISLQAVSKALKLVPQRFRFDLPREPSPSQQGRAVTCYEIEKFLAIAIDDPNAYEIHLNPDGRLWVVGPSASKQHIGEMSQPQSTRLISWVAEHLGQIVDYKNPIIDGEFPIGNARFFATLPPIVDGVTFAIRKRLAWAAPHKPEQAI